MSDSYSFDTPYTPDIERLAKQAQSAYDAYPSPEKADAVQREVAATKGREIAEKDPIRDRQIGRLRSDLGNVDRKYRDIQPLQSQPWRPDDHPISNPLEAFGSYAGVFAMVASAATRQPIENTLNAGAAAINSVRNADLASYERAHTAWKENFDQSLKVHQAEREDYKDAIENMKAGKEGADAELAAVSAKYGDKIIQQYLAAGMNKEAMDIIAKRADLADKLLSMAPQLQALGQQQYENVLFQSRVKEINAEHERDGKPRMNAQELVQLRGEIAQQMKNTDPDVIHTRRLEDQAEQELKAQKPDATAQEISKVRGDVRRAATGIFSPSKASGLDDEAHIDELVEAARVAGKPISRYEARRQIDADKTKAKTSASTLERLGSIDKAEQAWLSEHPEANGVVPQDVKSRLRTGYIPLSQEALRSAAERYVQTGTMPPNAGRGTAQGQAMTADIMEEANKVMAERRLTATDLPKQWQRFKSAQTAITRFESGPQGNIVRSLNVAIDHLGTIDNLAEALKNGNTQLFNRGAQYIAEQTGSAAPTNLEAAKVIVGPEIIKAIGVSGAGTFEERQAAAELWSKAKSPEQLAGATSTIKRLLAGQMVGLRQQYIHSTGLTSDDFNSMMLPGTLKELNTGSKEAGSLPEKARAALRDGVQTPFENGQVWTLKYGSPLRIK